MSTKKKNESHVQAALAELRMIQEKMNRLDRYCKVLKVVCPEVFEEYVQSKGFRYDYYGTVNVTVEGFETK